MGHFARLISLLISSLVSPLWGRWNSSLFQIFVLGSTLDSCCLMPTIPLFFLLLSFSSTLLLQEKCTHPGDIRLCTLLVKSNGSFPVHKGKVVSVYAKHPKSTQVLPLRHPWLRTLYESLEALTTKQELVAYPFVYKTVTSTS